jgi:hypothetical protein
MPPLKVFAPVIVWASNSVTVEAARSRMLTFCGWPQASQKSSSSACCVRLVPVVALKTVPKDSAKTMAASAPRPRLRRNGFMVSSPYWPGVPTTLVRASIEFMAGSGCSFAIARAAALAGCMFTFGIPLK